jgi:hypothetical protein
MSKYLVHTTPLGQVNVSQQNAVAGDFNALPRHMIQNVNEARIFYFNK